MKRSKVFKIKLTILIICLKSRSSTLRYRGPIQLDWVLALFRLGALGASENSVSPLRITSPNDDHDEWLDNHSIEIA